MLDQRLKPDTVAAQLRVVTRKLILQRQRRRILKMGTTDLDDPAPRLRLRQYRVFEPTQRGNQPARRSEHRRNVQRGRKTVVRRLAPVDVVVWGAHGVLPPRVPVSISLARPAITSLTFMFDCVPLPVCQMTSGN